MYQVEQISSPKMSDERAKAILARLEDIKKAKTGGTRSSRLLRALSEGSVAPSYQPIYCSARSLVGAESFVRWKDGDEYVAPVDLLSEIRTDSEAMEKLSIFMIDRACADLKEWIKAGAPAGFTTYVNVSPREFFNPEFALKVVDLLAMNAVPPGAIALELSDFEDGSELVCKSVFYIYARAGIPVCLDNVGKGAASFDLLDQMPFSEFKIDKTFTSLQAELAHRRKLASRWVAYAKEKGVRVTLGGIESVDQVTMFASESHVHYQGWLFGKDRPAEDFERIYIA